METPSIRGLLSSIFTTSSAIAEASAHNPFRVAAARDDVLRNRATLLQSDIVCSQRLLDLRTEVIAANARASQAEHALGEAISHLRIKENEVQQLQARLELQVQEFEANRSELDMLRAHRAYVLPSQDGQQSSTDYDAGATTRGDLRTSTRAMEDAVQALASLMASVSYATADEEDDSTSTSTRAVGHVDLTQLKQQARQALAAIEAAEQQAAAEAQATSAAAAVEATSAPAAIEASDDVATARTVEYEAATLGADAEAEVAAFAPAEPQPVAAEPDSATALQAPDTPLMAHSRLTTEQGASSEEGSPFERQSQQQEAQQEQVLSEGISPFTSLDLPCDGEAQLDQQAPQDQQAQAQQAQQHVPKKHVPQAASQPSAERTASGSVPFLPLPPDEGDVLSAIDEEESISNLETYLHASDTWASGSWAAGGGSGGGSRRTSCSMYSSQELPGFLSKQSTQDLGYSKQSTQELGYSKQSTQELGKVYSKQSTQELGKLYSRQGTQQELARSEQVTQEGEVVLGSDDATCVLSSGAAAPALGKGGVQTQTLVATPARKKFTTPPPTPRVDAYMKLSPISAKVAEALQEVDESGMFDAEVPFGVIMEQPEEECQAEGLVCKCMPSTPPASPRARRMLGPKISEIICSCFPEALPYDAQLATQPGSGILI